MNDQCEEKQKMWACRMDPSDSAASFVVVHGLGGGEAAIKRGSICKNGWSTADNCPIIGKVSHFGREEGVDLS